jgi:hypothetical protein
VIIGHSAFVECDITDDRLEENMSADACWWFENENGWWETGCSNLFQFVSGTPSENHFDYCPYCGKKITEASHD